MARGRAARGRTGRGGKARAKRERADATRGPQGGRLARRLRLLRGQAAAHATTAARLRRPASEAHLRAGAGPRGEPVIERKVHRQWYPVAPSPDECAAWVTRAKEQVRRARETHGSAPAVLLLGAGVGPALDAVLKGLCGSDDDTAWPAVVWLWDRDPRTLQLALERSAGAALDEALSSGRVRVALGSDLKALAEEVAAAEGALPVVVLEHPFLGALYRRERAAFDAWCESPERPTALLREGTLYVDDAWRALEARGRAVYTLDTEGLVPDELAHVAGALDAEALVAINYQPGLAEFARDHDLTLVVWEIDPTPHLTVPLQGPAARAHVATYRRRRVEAFEAAGFTSAEYVPLAADVTRRRPHAGPPDELTPFASPVAFVGASMVSDALVYLRELEARYQRFVGATDPSRAGDARAVGAEFRARYDAACDVQRADWSRYVFPQAFRAHLGDFQAYVRETEPNLDLVLVAAHLPAAEKRLDHVAALGDLGMRAWGDDGWSRAGCWAGRYAGHRDELPKVYAAAKVNVDVGRLYQMDIVPMRVFDCLACGGFLVAERSDALAECFELGVEVESYATRDELVAKVRHYLAHPAEARAIAEAGRRAVLERHTMADRFDALFRRAELGRGAAQGAPD